MSLPGNTTSTTPDGPDADRCTGSTPPPDDDRILQYLGESGPEPDPSEFLTDVLNDKPTETNVRPKSTRRNVEPSPGPVTVAKVDKPGKPPASSLDAKPPRPRSGDIEVLVMVVECVGCGIRSRVDVDRLHRKFRCKNCDTKMYLDGNGTWRKGVPPKALTQMVGDSAFGDLVAQQPEPGLLGRLWDKLTPRQQHASLLALLIAGIGAVAIVAAIWLSQPVVDVPQDLVSRTRYVIDTIAAGDRDAFDQMVASGTSDESREWFEKARKSLGAAGDENSISVATTARVLLEIKGDKAISLATVRMQLAGNAPAEDISDDESDSSEAATSRTRQLEFALYWKPSRGGWLLDGKETLNAK